MLYLDLLRSDGRLLWFGFLLSFLSCFGQTFFVSLFGADIRAEFGLSHGGFGLTYSVATVAGGVALIWCGRLVDRIDLKRYTIGAVLFYAAACVFFAFVPSLALLYVAIFALRLGGQGLMGLISISAMARYFDVNRGKAVGFASLGFHANQAVMPILAVGLSAMVGWRDSWLVFAAVLVAMIPLLIWLLGDQRARHANALAREAGAGAGKQAMRGALLRDARFYLLLPAAVVPPLINTGFFFHQIHIAESKGWAVAWMAGAFTMFALTAVLTVILGGPLVDRFSARRLMPLYLLPHALGTLVMALMDHWLTPFLFMALIGLSTGVGRAVTGALWAEVYGVKHIGALRGITQSLSVLATAIAPGLFGWLFDLDVTIASVSLICAGYTLAASAATVPVATGALGPSAGLPHDKVSSV